MDLKSLILHELLTDDSATDCEADCARVTEHYELAETDLKAVLDDIFISLTGYGLGTLITMADAASG